MTTTLTVPVVNRNEFKALNPTSEIAQAIQANLEATGEALGPDDLIRVPTPSGGGVTWAIPHPVRTENTEAIVGALCHYQRCGILWPSEEPSEGAMPVVRTFDLKVAEQVGPIPDDMIELLEPHRIDERHFNWETLPYNQFGSGKGGSGKRCKEQRMLFILRKDDPFPLLVTAQPGSLRNVSRFFKMLPSVAPVPYWRCVVELKLEKVKNSGGQPYSRIVPALKGILSPEDGDYIKRTYTDQLAKVARQLDVQPEDEDGDEE